jgi:glycosyltransferase involved in cell wall biosynthesis/ubiquinone/menaquinone biosynthesis C-methylase UbiE
VRCLYWSSTNELGIVDDPRLDGTTERHKLTLKVDPYTGAGPVMVALASDRAIEGLVLEMFLGWVGRDRLRLAGQALRSGHRVWVYWPGESALECIDRERVASHWRHWLFITALLAFRRAARTTFYAVRWVTSSLPASIKKWLPPHFQTVPDRTIDERARVKRLADLERFIARATPVPFKAAIPSSSARIPGCGVYLRTDFWAPITSGGSYGHTCYVAKELAAVTEDFICFMAHRYPLLDEYGLRQVVLASPGPDGNEDTIVVATDHYATALRAALQVVRPAYIYERLCLGNYAAAQLSLELNIPYFLEYNGSEISMKHSFDGGGYYYEAEYLQAEAFAFKQATMISVVSSEVKSGLTARGVDPNKILVNPNGADLKAYAPGPPDVVAQIRSEVGLAVDRPVVGFTGTFGGWHGIDVLAAALPRICARVPSAQFLLIGDGNFKHLVDDAIREHRLGDRVRCTGRVPQAQGARLLKACDLFVSPHSSHMVDSKFFGSPTKLFEYMAVGGGIVASDLEQIGLVLSPALTVDDLKRRDVTVADQRAVLCEPGNVDEFVEAVVGLLERPAVARALGTNARAAVEHHYSWARHVARLWPFLLGRREESEVADLTKKDVIVDPIVVQIATTKGEKVETGDAYKDQVQRQWDNDPAGSHYVKGAKPHTLEWFKEVEAYRYGHYAPWMQDVMEFDRHAGHTLLEIGAGIGTDLAQFAGHGAVVTDLDLSAGHLALARENFARRGLEGTFVHHDAERLPFDDTQFDVVYSNGVIHHTPNTKSVVGEIHRVLKPGGKAIIMVYAENSIHYWRNLVWAIGIKEGQLLQWSMGEIMSRAVERSDNASARPLVKVYTRRRLKHLFAQFEQISVTKRQMLRDEVPRVLFFIPVRFLGRIMGWNLIVKASKRTR